MSISRREFLEKAAAAGLVVTLPTLAACGKKSGDSGTAGDGLPVYEYDGPPGPETAFEHGVASGDPLSDAVVLWSRVSPGDLGDGPHEVFLEIADNPDFSPRLAADWYETDASTDFTIQVDATELAPATTYYFRFSALGRTSAPGRTRTAPAGASTHLRLGVVSCSNYAFGYFYAYRHLARRPDLDAVLHLGDYIYEYASKGHGETYGTFRELEPLHEIVALDDYRLRYSQYRRDPDLQEVHRQNPMIHIWDDHEFACDPYVGGATNHQPEDGSWEDRKAAALQACSEWLPTRLDGNKIYRHLAYGDLVDIVMLDRQRRFLWPEANDGDAYLGAEQAAWAAGTIAGLKAQWLLLGQGSRFARSNADGGGGWNASSRTEILDAVSAAGIENLVVLTGDIHKAGALDIVTDPGSYDATTGVGSVGVELYSNGVSSPGAPDEVGDIPWYFWSDGMYRGYLIVDLTPERLQADWFGFHDFNKVLEDEPAEEWRAGYTAEAGANHLVAASAPLATGNAPALAP